MLSRNLAMVHQPNLTRKIPRRRALPMSLSMRTRRRKLRIERVATWRQRMARTRMQALPKPPRSEGAGREDEATQRSETRCSAKKIFSRSFQTHRERSTSSRCRVRSCRQDRIVWASLSPTAMLSIMASKPKTNWWPNQSRLASKNRSLLIISEGNKTT